MPLNHPTNRAALDPWPQKRPHPSCTRVDSADCDEGEALGRCVCLCGLEEEAGVGVEMVDFNCAQTNWSSGAKGAGGEGEPSEGSTLFPHSSQQGQRWPSDSHPLP